MKITESEFIKILVCPKCTAGALSYTQEQMKCAGCSAVYPIKDSALYFASSNDDIIKKYDEEAGQFINRLKALIKKWPSLFVFLTYAIGNISYLGQKPKKTIEKLYGGYTKDKIIINVGSGIPRVHPDVVNLDIFPFKNVDIVADAASLPFKDNSVDMLISESTIEHTPQFEQVIKEMRRVVRPGGFVYISIPFLVPFHASPSDYTRLTHEGLKQQFSDFAPQKVGALGGPASALVTLLMYFFALPFSVFSEAAYNVATYFFMAILSPLRFFDLFFYLFPRSIEVSAMIYYIGEKKS